MSKMIRACAILIFVLSVLLGAGWAEEPVAPAERSEDVPNLGNYPEGSGAPTDEQRTNHAPQVFLTADPGWRVVAGTTTQTSPAGQQVSALIVAHGSDEDEDPLEYTFFNFKTGRVVGPSKENWVVVSPYHEPGSYPGKVIVKDTVSGQTAEAAFELVVVSGDDEDAGQAEGQGASLAARDIIKKGPNEEAEGETEAGTSAPLSNSDLLNCLCRCVKPENSDFDCSYNLTPYPLIMGGSPSCGDLKNGPCMCQAIGCFRAPLPTSGACYDACRDQFPGVSVEEPAQGDGSASEGEETTSPDEHTPGDLQPGATLIFNPESEPNNQIGDANEIKFASPVGVRGRITPADDVDYYRFYVESAGMLEVKLDQVPEGMKARIDLYGKNFNWVTRKDASNPGDSVALLADIPMPGQGFIAISDLDRKAHPADYSFVADFSPAADAGEPNNQGGDSTDLSLDQPVTAHICPVDDVDFYKLYVDSAGILVVRFDQVPKDMKTRIDLYGKNFNWITRKDASNAGDALNMEVDIPGPAAYYIALSDLNRLARSGPYVFEAQFRPAADQFEPNNQVGDATEIGLGQTVAGYICPVDDVDIFRLYLDAPATLQVSLEEVPASMRSRIDLYGKNFNWITRKDASNAGDAITLESDLSGPGSYYITVSDLDRKAHDQKYQFMAVVRSG